MQFTALSFFLAHYTNLLHLHHANILQLRGKKNVRLNRNFRIGTAGEEINI